MPKPSVRLDNAEAVAKRVAENLGFFLLEIELVKETTGRFLRFYIDKTDGISIDDCEAFHRKIQPLMDDIDYDYMEVSSPGAERPLKQASDFARALGRIVEVRLYTLRGGTKVFKGELTAYEDGCFTITDASGNAVSFEKKEVALVKPIVEVDEETLAGYFDEEDLE